MSNSKQISTQGVVAAPHYLAAEVGAEILNEGGNAFDAAVAVALAIGVTQPYHSGIGGGCSCTYVTADGRSAHVQARGPAPRRLTRDLFLDGAGKPDYELVKAGGLAIVVPTLIAGMASLHERFGLLPWSRVCLAAQPLAGNGFTADFMMARVTHMDGTIDKLSRFGQDSPFADPIVEGQALVQPRLAETMAMLADEPRAIYEGALARTIAQHVQGIGGVLGEDDLARYVPRETMLVEGSYRGWRILVPTSPLIGAVQTLLALQILDQFELGQYEAGSAEARHLVAEALKSTYIARAGLTDESEIARLATREMAADLAGRIEMGRALDFPLLQAGGDEQAAGGVAAAPNDAESCTSHFCIADRLGNVVSQTQTVRSYFGSGVVEPTSGIVLNDTVSDFSLRPGEVTTQGIRYNGHYNLVAAGAEPASSQSPILALHPQTGEVIAAGAAGGPMIVSATVQALVNQIDFGMTAQEASDAARVHCHGPKLVVEPALLGTPVVDQLAAWGHEIAERESIAVMQTIRLTGDGWSGAADRRAPGGVALCH